MRALDWAGNEDANSRSVTLTPDCAASRDEGGCSLGGTPARGGTGAALVLALLWRLARRRRSPG